MKPLSKLMFSGLKSVYDGLSYYSLSKTTAKALESRKLIIGGELTEAAKVMVRSKLTLTKQCDELNLSLTIIELGYSGRPEPALLEWFEQDNFIGSCSEFVALSTVVKALCLNVFEKYNFANSREDAITRYLAAQLFILRDKQEEMVKEILSLNKSSFLSNYKEIISPNIFREEFPTVTPDLGEAILESLGRERICELLNYLLSDPYSSCSGWPDLTVVKDGNLELIEVKTTDKLHGSQINTIPKAAKILGCPVKVYKIVKPN